MFSCNYFGRRFKLEVSGGWLASRNAANGSKREDGEIFLRRPVVAASNEGNVGAALIRSPNFAPASFIAAWAMAVRFSYAKLNKQLRESRRFIKVSADWSPLTAEEFFFISKLQTCSDLAGMI